MSNEQEYQPPTLETKAPAADGPLCGFDKLGSCITCSDEALPARVVSVEQAVGLVLAEVLGTPIEIDVSLVEAVAPGDWLLMHGGVAIAHTEGESDGSGSAYLVGKERDQ